MAKKLALNMTAMKVKKILTYLSYGQLNFKEFKMNK